MEGRYKVGEVMVQNVVVSAPNESIYDCARKMANRKIGALVIVDEESVVGIITEQDIARKVVAKGLIPRATPVSTVMSNTVHSVDPRIDMFILT